MPDPIPFPTPADPTYTEETTTRRHYTPATDKEGNSSKETTAFAPYYIRQIQKIIADGLCEYKTVGDFLRTAAYQWLLIVTQETSRPGNMHFITLMREHRQDLDVAEGMEAELLEAGRRVDQYMSQGRRADAMRLLAHTKHVLDSLPPGSWQDKYREDFQRRFSAYLQPMNNGNGGGAA